MKTFRVRFCARESIKSCELRLGNSCPFICDLYVLFDWLILNSRQVLFLRGLHLVSAEAHNNKPCIRSRSLLSLFLKAIAHSRFLALGTLGKSLNIQFFGNDPLCETGSVSNSIPTINIHFMKVA